jgi:Big-like domain-containing protein
MHRHFADTQKKKFSDLLSVSSCFLALTFLAGCSGIASNSQGTTQISPISPANVALSPGGKQQFTAVVTGNSNTAVNWEVNGTIGGSAQTGTISSTGMYTAPTAVSQATKFNVTAVSAADPTKSASATVTVNPAVGVAISPTSAIVGVNATQQFSATVSGTTNTAVTWSVDGVNGGNATVGTINSSGLYTAPSAPGAHTVTATSVADATKSATAAVTVKQMVSVAISPTTAALGVGTTQQFTATVTGTTNPGVTWSVDGVNGGNGSVGTITQNGLYTAPSSAGAHTVTATSVADPTKSANASVSVLSLTVSPSSATVAPNGTRQFTAELQGGNNDSVTWSVDGIPSGNNVVGTISATGLYTAPGTLGAHSITATSVEVPTLSANATVTVQNAAAGVVPVLTYHNDDVRDGANTNETTLNPSNVNSQQFGKKEAYPVDAQIYAQPLYVPNLTIDGAPHNTVFVATENNTVYAFDADGGSSTPLWENHLGTAPSNNDTGGISPLLGITSTPVIDPTTGTIYLVADTETSGGREYMLHALDITSGNEKFGGPVEVNGTVPGTGVDSVNGEITLEKGCYQRSALALDPISSAIYIPIGHCPHGWILAYDKTSLQQTAIMNATPNGAGGGFWAGGGTAAVDDNTGDLYIVSGVDAGDPFSGYNDSVLRLSAGDLSVLDYFTPSNEDYLEQKDLDFGSGTDVFMPDNGSSTPHEVIGGGKDGRIFVVNRDNMGQFHNPDQVIQVVQTGVQSYDNLFSTPAFWNNLLYFHSENDVLKVYSWDTNTGLLSTSPVSKGDVKYSLHGATTAISANGTSNGIAWEIDSSADTTGPAILHAYYATQVGTELYNSSQAGSRDTAGPAVKFAVPTIADGHVFVGADGELDVYGLLNQP